MYNRYIPEDETFTWTRAGEMLEGRPAFGRDRSARGPLGGLSALWSAGAGQGLSRLLRVFSPEEWDTGDILLLLIVLYLMVEGEDLEPVLALGLVLLLGLGED